MGDLGDHDLDLPFEASTGQLHDAAECIIVGGLVVMATVVDVPEHGPKPGLVFRFMLPTGRLRRPVLLIADDDQIAKLEPLMASAIAAARRAATEASS